MASQARIVPDDPGPSDTHQADLPTDETQRRELSVLLQHAIREAQAAQASAAPPSPAQLAAEAYGKLQYDFPLVRAEALTALQVALTDGGIGALLQFPVTAQLVNAVVEGARPRAVGGDASAAPESTPAPAANAAVRRAFQHLAGALFGSALQQLALADDERADALLTALHLAPADVEDAAGGAQLQPEPASVSCEPAFAALELEAAGGSSSDSDWEGLSFGAPAGGAGFEAPPDGSLALPLAQRVDAKLAWFGSRLRYELVDMPGVWDTLGLSMRLLNLLRALHARPRPCAARLQALVARTLCDRWMRVLDATLPAVLHLLAEDADSADEASSPLWLLASLTVQADAGAGADGGPKVDANALWPHVHACMATVVAPYAEQLAVVACAMRPAAAARPHVLAYAKPLGDVLALYALHAPGGIDVGNAFVPTGIVRSLVALLTADMDVPGLTAVRRALMLACAAAPAVAAYAGAVPKLSEVMRCDDPSHSALWPVVLSAPGARGAATQELCQLLSAAASDVAAGAAQSGAAVDALVLMKDAALAAGSARPVWAVGGDVAAALKALHMALLSRPTSSSAALAAPVEHGLEETPASPRAAEARDKVQTKVLALLRAVKDVLAVSSGSGTSRKMD